MKTEYQERRFKLNPSTDVVIKSVRSKLNTDLYENTITVVHKTAGLDPLDLKSRQGIESAIKGIDLTDPQVSMELGPGPDHGPDDGARRG